MIRWETGTEIGTQGRLEKLLEHISQQALGEGLYYEVAVEAVRRRALQRTRRELAAMEKEANERAKDHRDG